LEKNKKEKVIMADKKLTEAEVRDQVGALTIEEEEELAKGICCCGVKDCPTSYVCFSKGF
tara:strand:- start:338 stop:517 length:180 start_codon:yes stop_codon:yes gene_type:complete